MLHIIQTLQKAGKLSDTTPKTAEMPKDTIIYHQLSSGSQRRCCAFNPETQTTCQKRTRSFCNRCISEDCPKGTPLCEGICAVRFHNPHFNVIDH